MNRILAIETSAETCSVALSIAGEVRESFEHAPLKHAELILPMVTSLLAEGGVALADLDVIAFGRGPGSFTSLRIGIGVVQGLAWGADRPVAPVSSLAAVAQGVVDRIVKKPGSDGGGPGYSLREFRDDEGYSLREFRDDEGITETPVIPGLTRDLEQRTPRSNIVVAMDARMDEVFHAAFSVNDRGLVEAAGGERVSAPEDVAASGPWTAAGNGFERYDVLKELARSAGACLPDAWPRASAVVRLAAAWLEDNEPLAPALAQPVYIRDDVADKPRKV